MFTQREVEKTVSALEGHVWPLCTCHRLKGNGGLSSTTNYDLVTVDVR